MQYGPTFLQLVNTVLVRLREAQVTTVNSTNYSSMIGEFVNQSKRDVENAWNWQALRTNIPVTTVAGTSLYSLTGTDERAQILDAWNQTGYLQLRQISEQRMNEYYNSGDPVTQGVPERFAPAGQETVNGKFQVRVYPQPDAVYTLDFWAYAPTGDLSADGDRLYCSSRPVVELAFSKALQERGEDGGTGSMNQYQIAMQTLTDAIAIDANQNPIDIIWRAV